MWRPIPSPGPISLLPSRENVSKKLSAFTVCLHLSTLQSPANQLLSLSSLKIPQLLATSTLRNLTAFQCPPRPCLLCITKNWPLSLPETPLAARLGPVSYYLFYSHLSLGKITQSNGLNTISSNLWFQSQEIHDFHTTSLPSALRSLRSLP